MTLTLLTHFITHFINHIRVYSYFPLYLATLYLKLTLILDDEIVCLRFTLNLEYRGTELKASCHYFSAIPAALRGLK